MRCRVQGADRVGSSPIRAFKKRTIRAKKPWLETAEGSGNAQFMGFELLLKKGKVLYLKKRKRSKD